MNMKHGDARIGAVTRLHSIWRGMLKRCKPGNDPSATRCYAMRGIKVCPEWREFITFKAWALANGYQDSLSIDRIDNDGDYAPGNCRWSTRTQQARNRRTTRRITVNGIERSRAEWLEITGVTASAFHARLNRGWAMERALGIQLEPQE